MNPAPTAALFAALAITLASTIWAAAPSITTEPASVSLATREATFFQVEASGADLAYQWYTGNTGDTTAPVPGATGPLLVTLPLTATTTYWVRISNGEGHVDSAAATANVSPRPAGTVWQMGDIDYNEGATGDMAGHIPTYHSTGVTDISASGETLFLRQDGALWLQQRWDARFADTEVEYLLADSIYRKEDGNLYTPSSQNGELSDLPSDTVVYRPFRHSARIDTSHTLWMRGYNSTGQLGTGDLESRADWTEIESGVVSVAVGDQHTLFLKSDGTLWGMGSNSSGQLGDGTLVDASSPILLQTDVVKISAGSRFSLFLTANGRLWECGDRWADITFETPAGNPVPVPFVLAEDVREVVASENRHGFFIKTDDSLWAFGQNDYGQLGVPSDPEPQYSPRVQVPQKVAEDVLSVYTNSFRSFFITRGDGDSDADGLPDHWEMRLFGNLTTADATSDYDGDGQSDAQEFLFRRSPVNAEENFRVQAGCFPAFQNWAGFSYSFPGGDPTGWCLEPSYVDTRFSTYTVEWTHDLDTGPWQPVTGTTWDYDWSTFYQPGSRLISLPDIRQAPFYAEAQPVYFRIAVKQRSSAIPLVE
ncbi:MAG: hypothetical protein Q7P63_04060 [Verrucomicrobiota bacterium JB022]|nr:hypothetical protein [Verrucomicrobiota bacterium JB022]